MKNILCKLLSIFLLTCLTLYLPACSRESKTTKTQVMTIEQRSFANSLFYSGTIQPLKTIVVPSPADGVVVEMPFQYGEEVKTGQLLFQLSSGKFLTDYKTALMQYIKAKNDFNTSQSQLSEAKFLYKNQLISNDDFKMKQSNYYGARLALLQAKDALESLLRQLSIKQIDLYKLTIADFDKITQALHFEMNSESLRVLAPTTGVVLAPSKNEDDSKKTAKGDNIKQSDVLAVIGDMSGLSVHIKVNELTVNQLKIGQKVKITGIAFPEYELTGEIKRIDRQAEASTGGLPVFAVEVVVPHLTTAQQQSIHVGMSAKVEINIDEAPQLMIPIAAVHEKNGETMVALYNDKLKESRDVAVKIGKTTTDSVAILSGLKSGDKIVIPN